MFSQKQHQNYVFMKHFYKHFINFAYNVIMKQKYTLERALLVKAIIDKHYQAGRHDKSITNIFRTQVRKVYPMCERTFWKLYKLAREHEINNLLSTEKQSDQPL